MLEQLVKLKFVKRPEIIRLEMICGVPYVFKVILQKMREPKSIIMVCDISNFFCK